jgi:elongation factor Ts
MAITAEMVKDLREKTGAGMMDCKKALTETNGDMEASVKFLREKGLAAAAKKAGRVAAEGLVTFAVDGGVASLVEVNCETDFVGKNDDFVAFANDVAAHIAKNKPARLSSDEAGNGESLLDQKFIKDNAKSVKDVVASKVATIGENISVRRFKLFTGAEAYGTYLHGGGKVGVVVALSVGDKAKAASATVEALAKDIAMHVASEGPLAVSRDGVDKAVIQNERDIFIAQAKEQGKPDNIIEKMVEGKINKFLADSCLLDQAFIKDPDQKVGKLVEKTAKELGTTITVQSFGRFKVGEGIEKKSDNLAEEVAKMTKG